MSIPFDIHQLQCFIAVAEELHFGRAAQRMHLTQPPLSRQIKLLETRLNVRLFERNGREVRLTAAGVAFLEGAREVIQAAQTSTALARDAANNPCERLSIGFTPVAAYEVLPSLLQGFHETFPLAELALSELMTLPQLDALIRNDIDVALVRPSINLFHFDRMRVSVDALVAVLPMGHPLTKKKELRLSDFENQPFIDHDPVRAKYLADITSEGFRASNVAPRRVLACTEPQTMLAMVRAGLGLAIVAGQIEQYTNNPSVEFRPLKHNSLPAIEIWMMWRKRNRSLALEWLIRSAAEYVSRAGI